MYKILLIFLIVFSFVIFADTQESLLKIANQAFPGYDISIKDYDYAKINSLISSITNNSPATRALQKKLEQTDLEIKVLQKSFVPQFKLGANQNMMDIRERLVSIYTKIPVKWDNANPQQIDVNLPNGGHGILWMPKPTEYDWKYIDIHASRPFESNSIGFTSGLSYNYHSGISLDILNLGLNKRYNPETYGYSWYSSLDNSITIPVFKLFNTKLSPRETQIANIKNTQQNLKISIKLNQVQENNRLQSFFLNLYLSWEKHLFYRNMIKIINSQIKENIALSKKERLTIMEKIAVENELQGYKSAENIVYYEILNNAFALKHKKKSLTIYKPQNVNLLHKISILEKEADKYMSVNSLDEIIKKNPQLKMIENNLKSTKSNLKLISKLNSVQFDVIGNVSLFTSSDLGYKTPQDAIENVYTNPDGYNASIGLQFSMPLSFEDTDYKYQVAIKNYQISCENFKASKDEFVKNYYALRIGLLNKKEESRIARANWEYAKSRYLMTKEFFDLKRVSRFELNSYLKEKIKAEFHLKEAVINYFIGLNDFLSFMNVNETLKPVLSTNGIRKTVCPRMHTNEHE